MSLPRHAAIALWAALLAELIIAEMVCAQGPPQSPQDPAASSSASAPQDSIGGTAAAPGGLDLNLSLEQLSRQDVVVPGLSTPVTTVERQPSTIGRTPAAVFVITSEMIERSGARNVPDVLRMAPGVDVARIDAHTWAISIRGFNNRFANKLLVQIDGRIVYNATFGGVYWEQQNVVLEDVERIEVIRGPGTTMWGSNAVNGVINIITKKASDTQGLLVQSGGGGQDQRDFNIVRYGGSNGAGLNWRVWGQQSDPAAGWSPDGVDDAWHLKDGGFRIDYTPNEEDTFTVIGDLMYGKGGELTLDRAIPAPPFSADFPGKNTFPNGNILARYGRVLDEDTSWQIQSYYDAYQQVTPEVLVENREMWDIDVQYQFSPAPCHQFITGADYRRSQDSFVNTFAVGFEPTRFLTQWAGVFAQDTITLDEDRLYLTLGVRLEYNTFGKFQPEPTARLLLLPSERQSLWCAISRSARNPARNDTGLDVKTHIGGPMEPVFLNILGNPNIDAENLVAYEVGYRAAPTDNFTWDIAGYINDYNKLIASGPVGAPIFVPPGLILLPTVFQNNTRALSYGFETTATYQVHQDWRLFATYSLFEVNAAGPDPFALAQIEGSNPRNMVYLRSAWDLSRNLRFDLIGRYVDNLSALNVPRYFEMDTRIAWQATETLEFSFVGQNLLNNHHLEFVDIVGGLASTQVRRSCYGMVTWSF